jgi:hypothetical protein
LQILVRVVVVEAGLLALLEVQALLVRVVLVLHLL